MKLAITGILVISSTVNSMPAESTKMPQGADKVKVLGNMEEVSMETSSEVEMTTEDIMEGMEDNISIIMSVDT